MPDFLRVNFNIEINQFLKSLSQRELGDLIFHANHESQRRTEEMVNKTALTSDELYLVARRDKVQFAKTIRDRLGTDNVRLVDASHIYEAACKRVPSVIERV